MSIRLARKRIRLQVEISKGYGAQIMDALTGAAPQLWKGNDVQFECAFYFGDELIDIGNLVSVTLEVKSQSDRDGTPVMSKTVTFTPLPGESDAVLDGTLTDATWADNTKQHALIPFTSAETNVAVDATSQESDYWLVISAVTDEGRQWTFGYSIMKVVEDGHGTADSPPVNDPVYYTKEEADAVFATKGTLLSQVQSVKIWNAEQNKYVEFICVGAAGQESLAPQTGG